MRIMSLLPLALFACGEKEEVEIEGPIDADNDGFNELEDCDDSLASYKPGAFDSVQTVTISIKTVMAQTV